MPSIEVIPSARRLIKSLRDLGYDFVQAVADVVDNSIEAGASLVAIDIEFDGDESWVRIADNGKGMKPDELREAMRYGSERDYGDGDLGKFGLGLKTASMSQCSRLAVASRWNANRADIKAYAWDLEHIQRTNRWEILEFNHGDASHSIRQPLQDTTGTVVFWQRLDRILGYKHPYGEAARKQLSNMCRQAGQHLSMVFHRFLAGEIRGKKLKILLNGNKINAWDPFCRNEPATILLDPIRIQVDHEGTLGEVVVEPYILPAQGAFSSPDAFRAASGPANWNQQQGFYIYRAGRMIQSGGWSNLHAPDEHLKLARVAVSFLPVLDEAFRINVAKMRVQLPAESRMAFREAIAPVRKRARFIYDRKTPEPGIDTSLQMTHPAASLSAATPSRSEPASSPLLTLKQWTERTMAKATAAERPVVAAVLSRL